MDNNRKKSNKVTAIRLPVEHEKKAERQGLTATEYISRLLNRKPKIEPTKHVCPLCGENFEGRKNKKYCSYTCQVDNKNKKAKQLRITN